MNVLYYIDKKLYEQICNYYHIEIDPTLNDSEFYANFVDKFESKFYNHKLIDNFSTEDVRNAYWDHISCYVDLNEDFIKEHADKVNWDYISAFQALSEDFIREFSDRVDWGYISTYQKLSETFIRDNINKVCLDKIYEFQNLSEEFMKEFDSYNF
jgi:hypothetical protein